MSNMEAQILGLTPINQINWLEFQSGQEITRPWSFAVNGVATISNFLANAGLPADGTIDVRGLVMPWDVDVKFSDGTLIGNLYKFSWSSSLTSTSIQPYKQYRVMSRSMGSAMTVTFEEYMIDDIDLMASKFRPFLAIKGGTDQDGSTLTAFPSIDLIIHVADNSNLAATF